MTGRSWNSDDDPARLRPEVTVHHDRVAGRAQGALQVAHRRTVVALLERAVRQLAPYSRVQKPGVIS